MGQLSGCISYLYEKEMLKNFQRKTFTAWVNAILAEAETDIRVKDLNVDLKDGTALDVLLSHLTQSETEGGHGKIERRGRSSSISAKRPNILE